MLFLDPLNMKSILLKMSPSIAKDFKQLKALSFGSSFLFEETFVWDEVLALLGSILPRDCVVTKSSMQIPILQI